MSPSLPFVRVFSPTPSSQLPAPAPRAEAPAALRSVPADEPTRAQVPRAPVPALPTWCRRSPQHRYRVARPWPPRRASLLPGPTRRALRGGRQGARRARRGGLYGGSRGGGGRGRERLLRPAGGRSAGRRDRAGALVVPGAPPPQLAAAESGTRCAPPRLLPAACWRVSPLRSRDPRLFEGRERGPPAGETRPRPSSGLGRGQGRGSPRGEQGCRLRVPKPPFPRRGLSRHPGTPASSPPQ